MGLKEKRKHQRINSLNLSYICLDENQNIVKQGMGRTLNVSESGILLETHFPIETDNTVMLTLGLEEILIDVKGQAVHSRASDDGTYEIGIEFRDADDQTSQKLKNSFLTDRAGFAKFDPKPKYQKIKTSSRVDRKTAGL